MASVPSLPPHFHTNSRRTRSLIQIVHPERVERVFTELGKRVIRKATSGETGAFHSEVSKFREALKKQEKCLNCQQIFEIGINYRYRACRLHFEGLVFRNYNRVYSCCGKPTGSPGCVSCMHVSRKEMFELMRENPLTAYIEVSKLLIDSGQIPISKEIIVGYPHIRPILAEKRRLQLLKEQRSGDEIREEDWVYRINMVAISPAPVSLYFD
jgi:hypothetical protein